VTLPETSDPVISSVPGESAVKNASKSVLNETSDAALVKLSIDGVSSDSLEVANECEEVINENMSICEQCGFKSKSSRGLKVHIRTQHRISQIDGADDIIEESTSGVTQTKEACPYCRDEKQSLQKQNVNGFCPKNIEAQRLVLYQQY
jgi:RNA polymerase subunit RPABC4/transcription elongation factor Spt4